MIRHLAYLCPLISYLCMKMLSVLVCPLRPGQLEDIRPTELGLRSLKESFRQCWFGLHIQLVLPIGSNPNLERLLGD